MKFIAFPMSKSSGLVHVYLATSSNEYSRARASNKADLSIKAATGLLFSPANIFQYRSKNNRISSRCTSEIFGYARRSAISAALDDCIESQSNSILLRAVG